MPLSLQIACACPVRQIRRVADAQGRQSVNALSIVPKRLHRRAEQPGWYNQPGCSGFSQRWSLAAETVPRVGLGRRHAHGFLAELLAFALQDAVVVGDPLAGFHVVEFLHYLV